MGRRDLIKDLAVLIIGTGAASILASLTIADQPTATSVTLYGGIFAIVAGLLIWSRLYFTTSSELGRATVETGGLHVPRCPGRENGDSDGHRYSDLILKSFGDDIGLPPDVTAATILGECEGKTDLECQGSVARFIGQRLTVSGRMYAATPFSADGASVSIELDGVERGTAWMAFEDDRTRLAVLKEGSRITASGRIVDVSAREVRMADCRLL